MACRPRVASRGRAPATAEADPEEEGAEEATEIATLKTSSANGTLLRSFVTILKFNFPLLPQNREYASLSRIEIGGKGGRVIFGRVAIVIGLS